jgi:hypothetical protein
MATTITAGNATNGAAISSDNTGTLDIKTGTGAGTTALSINASQQVTLPGNLVVTGTATVNGQPVGGNYVLNNYVAPTTWDVNAKKAAGLKAVKVTVFGGGGNTPPTTKPSPPVSGPASGGGGGGGVTYYYADAPTLTPSPTGIVITAGAGTNSFGPYCSATGGGDGVLAPNGAGGAGGVGIGGYMNLPGQDGNPTTSPTGGAGAASVVIILTQPGGLINQPGTTPPSSFIGCGAGGVGQRSATLGTSPGGTGAPGIVIVEEFY